MDKSVDKKYTGYTMGLVSSLYKELIMKCPICKVWSFVLSTRNGVMRRRECANGHRFSTIEILKTYKRKGVKNDKL